MDETQTPTPTPARIVFDPAWDMVKQVWRWYNDHLNMLLQLSLISAVPGLLLNVAVAMTNAGNTLATSKDLGLIFRYGLGFFIASLITVVWSMLGTIAIYRYLQQPDNQQSSWQQFIGARTYALNYFSTGVLYGLIVMAGLLLFIIPGIIWAITFSLAPLLSVIEGSRSDALRRSRDLIKGYWFDVFWRGLLLGLTVIGISIVASVVFSIINRAGLGARSSTLISDLLHVLLNACLTPVPLIMSYLIYLKLARKA